MSMETMRPGPADLSEVDFAPFAGDQCVVMDGLEWADYSTMLRMKGDRTYPKLVYLDGRLWLMSPSWDHEQVKTRSGRLVDEVAVGLGLRCVPSAQTTFRRKKKRGGFEADQSYYLASKPVFLPSGHVDLKNGPPPDLVIEAVYTHAAEATIATCRRLNVPEMWICDEQTFRILVLQSNGRYAEAVASKALPFLTGEEIESWLRRPYEDDETKWALELRQWVRDVLVPRVRGGNAP